MGERRWRRKRGMGRVGNTGARSERQGHGSKGKGTGGEAGAR
jgi:hypothetical protein